MTTQAERIDALEQQVAILVASLEAAPKLIEAALRQALNAELQPLAERVVEAHTRINHAGEVFKEMRNALRPSHEPARLPRAEFDRALDDLRAEAETHGLSQRYFSTPAILERAATLRRMEENARAA